MWASPVNITAFNLPNYPVMELSLRIMQILQSNISRGKAKPDSESMLLDSPILSTTSPDFCSLKNNLTKISFQGTNKSLTWSLPLQDIATCLFVAWEGRLWSACIVYLYQSVLESSLCITEKHQQEPSHK